MLGPSSNADTRRVARAPVTRASAASTSTLVRSASSMRCASVVSPRSRQKGAADTAAVYCADSTPGVVIGPDDPVRCVTPVGDAVTTESREGVPALRAIALYDGATRTVGG